MSTSELESRNISISMRKSVENLVISSQDAIGQSISQALTFSGVITQQATQIIQETRNVSRSPSPSLRNPDSGTEQTENEKSGDTAANTGDTVSVSSASDVTSSPAPAVTLRDNKTTSPSPAAKGADGVGGGGGTRTKKKSWYNALYPTYKSKSEDFKRLFKDLPEDERLIVDYSCALQKDILAHGRLYASQNYLCFYASIFGWETTMSLRWKDITAITKEKTALVIPNAILVCTEGEKNFLTSFSGRDKAYLMLFRIWQNALMDQHMSSQEIWQWVHSCYGEELGFNSDDECYTRDLPLEDRPVVAALVPPEELVDTSSVEASGADGKDELRSSRSASRGRDSSPPRVNGDGGEYREEAGDTLPTDMSDTSDSEPDKNNSGDGDKCTSPHDGKLMMKQQFPFSVDQMFTMMFTNSKFYLEMMAIRGITDYVQAPWQPQGGLKCRQLSYTVALTAAGPIGPKEVHVTETQVMNKCSRAGVLYSIESTSENTGIPYAEYFSVRVHFCVRRAEGVGGAGGAGGAGVELAIYGRVDYKKSMWPMIKAFLEKNTMSGLDEFCRLLEARLQAEAERAAPAALKGRRRRRRASSSQEVSASVGCAAGGASELAASAVGAVRGPVRGPAGRAGGARGSGGAWLVGILLVLLAINALLYWRLYHVDDYHHRHHHIVDRVSALSESQMAEWSSVLQRHARAQRGQLRAWSDALHRAVAHLAQTEAALTKLMETIKVTLENAQQDDKHSEL